MHNRVVTVFGGSGFIGTSVVNKLLNNGFLVNVLTRNMEKAKHLKLIANMGHLNIINGNIFDKDDVSQAILNSEIVINCVGTIIGNKQKLFDINYNFPKILVDVINGSENNVKHLIHFSAIVDQRSDDNYTISKLKAKAALKSVKCKLSILNPSVVFGEDDMFFNFFADVSKYLIVLPLINNGKTLIQPVFVQNVSEFVIKIIQSDSFGEFYLTGPKKYSMREIYNFVCTSLNRKRFLINLPNKIAMMLAYVCEIRVSYFLTKILTGKFIPFLTRDQVKLLTFDNVSEVNSLTKFGISPQSIEHLVPTYLKK